jgi:D-aminoacyl-tRNA deacylase
MSAEFLKIRIILQKFLNCEVFANKISCGKMDQGFLLFFGVGQTQAVYPLLPLELDIQNALNQFSPSLKKLTDKILGLRIFPDEAGKMNLSLKKFNEFNQKNSAGIYLVSQFTLFANTQNGFRPSFNLAAPSPLADAFYEKFKLMLQEENTLPFLSGEFGSDMQVCFTNDGPVTILFEANVSGLT